MARKRSRRGGVRKWWKNQGGPKNGSRPAGPSVNTAGLQSVNSASLRPVNAARLESISEAVHAAGSEAVHPAGLEPDNTAMEPKVDKAKGKIPLNPRAAVFKSAQPRETSPRVSGHHGGPRLQVHLSSSLDTGHHQDTYVDSEDNEDINVLLSDTILHEWVLTMKGIRPFRMDPPGSPTPVKPSVRRGVLDSFVADLDKTAKQGLLDDLKKVDKAHGSPIDAIATKAGRLWVPPYLIDYRSDDGGEAWIVMNFGKLGTHLNVPGGGDDSRDSWGRWKVIKNKGLPRKVPYSPYIEHFHVQRLNGPKVNTWQNYLAQRPKAVAPPVVKDPRDPRVIYQELVKLEVLCQMNLNREYRVACHWLTPAECMRMNKSDKMCPDKYHFKRIIHCKTNIRYGDCPFLDACHDPSECVYVHYEIIMPKVRYTLIDYVLANVTPEMLYAGDLVGWKIPIHQRSEPEWINHDLKQLDFGVLGKFAAIMIDPPWDIHMNLPYEKISDAEIMQMPVQKLQDEGILLLWCTSRAIEQALECLKHWGYEYVDEVIWVKVNQLLGIITTGRTGHWTNHAKEHCIIGLKGKPKWLKRNLDLNYIIAEVRETSRKPDEIYDIVDRLVGPAAPKIELFGRAHNIRKGWLTVGKQLPPTQIKSPKLFKAYSDYQRQELLKRNAFQFAGMMGMPKPTMNRVDTNNKYAYMQQLHGQGRGGTQTRGGPGGAFGGFGRGKGRTEPYAPAFPNGTQYVQGKGRHQEYTQGPQYVQGQEPSQHHIQGPQYLQGHGHRQEYAQVPQRPQAQAQHQDYYHEPQYLQGQELHQGYVQGSQPMMNLAPSAFEPKARSTFFETRNPGTTGYSRNFESEYKFEGYDEFSRGNTPMPNTSTKDRSNGNVARGSQLAMDPTMSAFDYNNAQYSRPELEASTGGFYPVGSRGKSESMSNLWRAQTPLPAQSIHRGPNRTMVPKTAAFNPATQYYGKKPTPPTAMYQARVDACDEDEDLYSFPGSHYTQKYANASINRPLP